MTKIQYKTTYKSGMHEFQSYIFAESLDNAKLLLKQRGLGEEVHGRTKVQRIKTVKLYKQGDFVSCIHAVLFLGLPLINAKKVNWKRLWSLQHYLIHSLQLKERGLREIRGNIHKTLLMLKEFDKMTGELGY